MTDATIKIGIKADISGAKTIKRNLDEVAQSSNKAQQNIDKFGKKARETGGSTQFLSNTLKTLAASFGIRELVRTADVYTNIQNRLKLVTTSTEQLGQVTNELFQISNNTRQSFSSTAEVYSRVALATKDMGLSARESLDFTESLNQAVALSGASATEASAGLLQLSQGLASGTLRGEELNSVLEQLPMVADVIADGLGITRGQLRAMGQEGKITAENVINAFSKAREELSEKFGKMVPTIGQSFTVLKNKVVGLVGELDAMSGSSEKLSMLILFLGTHVDKLAFGLAGAASAFALVKGAMMASSVASMTVGSGFTAMLSLLTGPAGLVAAFALTATAIAYFSDDLKNTLNATIADSLHAIDELGSGLGELMMGIANYASGGRWSDGLAGNVKEAVRLQNEERARAYNRRMTPTETHDYTDLLNQKGIKKTTASKQDLENAKSAQKELAKLISNTRTEQESLYEEIAKIEKLRAFATTAEEVEALDRALLMANEKLKTASDQLPHIKDGMQEISQVMDRFGESVADAFVDFVNGTLDARSALKGLANDMLKMMFQKNISNPLGGFLSDGLSSLFSGGFSGFFGGGSSVRLPSRKPAFDSGGSMVLGGYGGIDNNLLSLNGNPIANVSRGEVLSVSPNSNNGGGIQIYQTFQISTGVKETVAAEMEGYVPKIREATMAAVKDAQARGI